MFIVKRYTYFDTENVKSDAVLKGRHSTQSKNWVMWFCVIRKYTCVYCASQSGRIFSVYDETVKWPPVHDNCGCCLIPLTAFSAGTVTEDGLDGVDYYLFTRHCLPENYMTQEEAMAYGWIKGAWNLRKVLPGTVIGGGIYKNVDKRLPEAPGRIWYEADFDYNGGRRNGRRILFSNDGLMFATFDHYRTFSEVYWGYEDLDDFYD